MLREENHIQSQQPKPPLELTEICKVIKYLRAWKLWPGLYSVKRQMFWVEGTHSGEGRVENKAADSSGRGSKCWAQDGLLASEHQSWAEDLEPTYDHGGSSQLEQRTHRPMWLRDDSEGTSDSEKSKIS